MMNDLHVEVKDTGQDATEEQNIRRKPGDKGDIIGANSIAIITIARGELNTGDQGGKRQKKKK